MFRVFLDPGPVAQTIFVDEDVSSACRNCARQKWLRKCGTQRTTPDEVSDLYELDGIVTVVDAKHCLEHLKEQQPKFQQQRRQRSAN